LSVHVADAAEGVEGRRLSEVAGDPLKSLEQRRLADPLL